MLTLEDEPQLLKEIGKRISIYRNKNGVMQQDLADLLKVSCSTISRYESGEINMPVSHYFIIADTIGMSPSNNNGPIAYEHAMKIIQKAHSKEEYDKWLDSVARKGLTNYFYSGIDMMNMFLENHPHELSNLTIIDMASYYMQCNNAESIHDVIALFNNVTKHANAQKRANA